MLVLTRKFGEAIVIGDDIRITVLSGQGNQIKIGIEAPKDVSIYREELGGPRDTVDLPQNQPLPQNAPRHEM